MGAFISKFGSMWFPAKEYKIIVVGLDNAGKTTTLYKLHLGEVVTTHPTVGSNVEEIVYKNIRFEVYMQPLYALLCWFIWKSRNEWIYQHKQPSDSRVISQAMEALSKMDNVENEVLARGNPNQVESEWSKPPMGWIKINCDGAYCDKSNSAAYAVVARNHEGILLTGVAARLIVSSALVAEACAIRRAASIAPNKGYREVIIKSDSKALVFSLNQGSTATIREIEAIQQDIWHYVKGITKVIFKLTRRSCNSAAHTLAMHSRQGTLPSIGYTLPQGSWRRSSSKKVE